MPLFKKSSSSKIPPVEAGPPGGSFNGGYGAPQQGGRYAQAGPPPPQNGVRGGAPPGRMGPGYGGAPSGQDYGRPPPQGYEGGGFNGAGNYDSYQQQPQRQLFANARAPSSSFGASYDDHANSSKQRGLARNVSSVGATDDDLEAEYGRGRGGDAGGASSSAYDGLEQQDQAEQEEDDEVEAVKQQMRFTKQESLSSTRNALRIAREAEETATNTMLKLGDQSEKIANTERHLDMAKAHSSRADDNAKEIVALNRSIFRPNIQFNKKAKRDAEEARIIQRHIDEREEREAVRQEALNTQRRVDNTMGAPGSGKTGSAFSRFGGDRFGPGGSGGDRFGAGKPAADPKAGRLQARMRYQFEATESDDELEGELDDNLDEIGQLSGRLNQLGRAMGSEIDEQNTRIKRVSDKTTALDTRIYAGTQKLGRIK